MVSQALGFGGGNVIGQAVLEIITDNSKAKQELSDMQRNLAAGVAVAFGAATIAATGFETRMTKIETLVGINRATLQGWSQDVTRIATAVGRGPTELADALFVITSAGERGSEALDILEASAKASANGLGQTAEIARTVTAAMQAWGQEGLTAAQATDVLFATVREGNLEAADLATSLGRVLGIAAEVGLTFEDVGAFIATYTRLGVRPTEAVSALRSALNNILRPSEQAVQSLATVGLTMDDIRRKISEDGLADALIYLIESFDGNTEALARVIPDAEGLAGVLGTAGRQADAFRQISESLRKSIGLNEQAFETVSQTTEVSFRRALASVQVILVLLGTEILPPVADGLQAIASAVTVAADGFSSLPGPVRTAVVALVLFGAAWPVINAGIERFRTNAIAAQGGMLSIGRNALIMRSGLIAGSIALGMIASESDNAAVGVLAMTAQGAAMGALFGGPVAIGVGAAAGAIIGLASNMNEAEDAATKLETAVSNLNAEIERQAAAATGEGASFDRSEAVGNAIRQQLALIADRAALTGTSIETLAKSGEMGAESITSLLRAVQQGGSITAARDPFGGRMVVSLDALIDRLGYVDENALRVLLEIAGGTRDVAAQFDLLDQALVASGGTFEDVRAIGEAFNLTTEQMAALFPKVAAASAGAADGVGELGGSAERTRQTIYELRTELVALSAQAAAAEGATRILAARDAGVPVALLNSLRDQIAGRIREALETQIGVAQMIPGLLEQADPEGALRSFLDDLNEQIGGVADRGGKATAEELTLSQRIAQQRAEEVFNAISDAMINGLDPAPAVAEARAEFARIDALWPRVVEAAQDFGVTLTEEMRLAFENAGREVERQGNTIGGLLARMILRQVQGGADPSALVNREQLVAGRSFIVEGDLVIGADTAGAVSVATVQRGVEGARFREDRG